MQHTQVGHCTRCGSPLYVPSIWNGVTPPPTIYSCACFPEKVKSWAPDPQPNDPHSKLLDDIKQLVLKQTNKIEDLEKRLGELETKKTKSLLTD